MSMSKWWFPRLYRRHYFSTAAAAAVDDDYAYETDRFRILSCSTRVKNERSLFFVVFFWTSESIRGKFDHCFDWQWILHEDPMPRLEHNEYAPSIAAQFYLRWFNQQYIRTRIIIIDTISSEENRFHTYSSKRPKRWPNCQWIPTLDRASLETNKDRRHLLCDLFEPNGSQSSTIHWIDLIDQSVSQSINECTSV